MTKLEIPIPEDVTVTSDHLDLVVDGPVGSVRKQLWFPNVTVDVADGAVVIASEREDAKTTATIGTFESHVENMFFGVTEGWEYEMEAVYAHFPMQIRVEGGDVVVENFLGERSPRRTTIHGDTEVEIDGESLVISGPDKEAVGQTAADIEQLTRVRDKDTRVFQDGVYITRKPSTEV